MQACSENYVDINGVRFCWFEWGAENRQKHKQKHRQKKTVLLVHATGFHARCWDETVKHLPDCHVVAMDMRGHGRSDKKGPYDWDVFGQDVTEFVRALDLQSITGVGHSMGGHSLVQAAAEEQGRFEKLVLVDPVILAPEAYATTEAIHDAWLNDSGEHPVARRRNHFDNVEAMFNNFLGRGGFAYWQDEVLYDYCKYGLVDNPDGEGFVLACPPQVEASIYMGSSGRDIYEQIRAISVPTIVLRAEPREEGRVEMDFSKSPTWECLAEQFENGRDVYLPEMSHFIPMQNPGLVAEYIGMS